MSIIRVATNFNIDLEFAAAPFHRRFLAWLLDVCVLIIYILFVSKVLWVADDNKGGLQSEEAQIVLQMLLVIPALMYHLICEILLKGQSVGKRIMGLRVVTEEGGRPSIGQFLIRWFIRTSDYMVILIMIYAPVGFGGDTQFFWQVAAAFGLLVADIILANSSKKNQRLGDKADIHETIFLEVREGYTPQFPEVMRLSDRDINALKGILDAAKKGGDYNLADRAAEKIKNHLHIQSHLSPFDFLEILLKDYNFLSAH
jgi:uncharacterized RDD family membrane protein YckC